MRASGAPGWPTAAATPTATSSTRATRVARPARRPVLHAAPRLARPRPSRSDYYYGLANEGLWPLCHIAFHRPAVSPRDWEGYREANRIFADAVLEEAGGRARLRVHSGLPLRPAAADAEGAQSEPDGRAVLAHSLAQPRDVPRLSLEGGAARRNARQRPARLSPALPLRELPGHRRPRPRGAWSTPSTSTVMRGGHGTRVRPFPISIDFERARRAAALADGRQRTWTRWRRSSAQTELLGIGIDRVDYTKGIPDRLPAIDRLLERPSRVRRPAACSSRSPCPAGRTIGDYQALNDEMDSHGGRDQLRGGRAGSLAARSISAPRT